MDGSCEMSRSSSVPEFCLLLPTLELNSRAAPSVEEHHSVNGPDTGRNSGGRQIKNEGFEGLTCIHLINLPTRDRETEKQKTKAETDTETEEKGTQNKFREGEKEN